jgi:alpha-glucosidase
MAVLLSWCVLAVAAASASATSLVPRQPSDDPLAACPGYKASRIQTSSNGLTADLTLAGPACNVYGTDLTDLTLEVVYETGTSTSCILSQLALNKS